MVIFHSYVSLPEGRSFAQLILKIFEWWFTHSRMVGRMRQHSFALICLIFAGTSANGNTPQLSTTRNLNGLQVAILVSGLLCVILLVHVASKNRWDLLVCPQDWLIFFFRVAQDCIAFAFHSLSLHRHLHSFLPAVCWVVFCLWILWATGSPLKTVPAMKNSHFIRWFYQHFPAFPSYKRPLSSDVPGFPSTTCDPLACARWRSGSTSSSCWSSLATEQLIP